MQICKHQKIRPGNVFEAMQQRLRAEVADSCSDDGLFLGSDGEYGDEEDSDESLSECEEVVHPPTSPSSSLLLRRCLRPIELGERERPSKQGRVLNVFRTDASTISGYALSFAAKNSFIFT